MKQSKQAEQMIEFMEMLDQIDISERDYMSNMAGTGKNDLPNVGPESKPNAGGPGTVNRSTPNDYDREDVAKMLDYASKFVKDSKQMESWKYSKEFLNTVGAAMSQFMSLKKGDPGLEYKEGEMQGDQHAEPYSDISFGKKSAKGSASAEMKGKAKGDTTSRSKEGDISIDKEKLPYGFRKGTMKGYGE